MLGFTPRGHGRGLAFCRHHFLNQIDVAFDLHDKDGDGKLNKTEMANMIAKGKKAKAEKEAKEAKERSSKQKSAKKGSRKS